MDAMIPLRLLVRGEPAVVEDLCGPDGEVHRLREMGFEPGVEVEMVRVGNPCIVRVGHHRLCLRCDDSIHILVRPKPYAAPTRDVAV